MLERKASWEKHWDLCFVPYVGHCFFPLNLSQKLVSCLWALEGALRADDTLQPLPSIKAMTPSHCPSWHTGSEAGWGLRPTPQPDTLQQVCDSDVEAGLVVEVHFKGWL